PALPARPRWGRAGRSRPGPRPPPTPAALDVREGPPRSLRSAFGGLARKLERLQLGGAVPDLDLERGGLPVGVEGRQGAARPRRRLAHQRLGAGLLAVVGRRHRGADTNVPGDQHGEAAGPGDLAGAAQPDGEPALLVGLGAEGAEREVFFG